MEVKIEEWNIEINRERERDTNIGIKGVLGVVRFGSFTSVLEQQEAIEVFLRELHVVRSGLDWTGRRGDCCCERNCVCMCCELCVYCEPSPRVWNIRLVELLYALTLQLCACAAGSDSIFCFKGTRSSPLARVTFSPWTQPNLCLGLIFHGFVF